MAGKRQPGGCLCGAVRFSAVPQNHFHACHCDSCRRWAGGVYLGCDVGDTLQVEDEAHVTFFKSSEWAQRGFCSRCGSTLFWKAPEFGVTYVAYNAFDTPPEGAFETELYIDRKPDSYSFQQPTKKMTKAEVEAQFSDGQT